MRLMGLDVGKRRIGVALSDERGWLAQGTEVIERDGRELSRLEELVRKKGVVDIVVGLPRRMDGTLGSAAKDVEDFVGALQARLQLPVHLWDERLTTVEAERRLIMSGYRRKKRQTVIDSVAAELILQGYLDRQMGKEE